MKKEREIKRYYKTAFFKGRGMFARFADFLAFRIIAFILLYVWFSSAVKNDILKILLPLISLSILSVAAELLKSIRFERFTAAEKNRLKTEILCERFTLLPKQELFKLVREYTSKNPDRFPFDCSVSVLQKTSPITTDDLLAIYQNTLKRELCHAAVFCTAVVSKEALAFAKKQKNEITLCFITASDMAEFIKYNIS
ncbi:MAG: hypothetical protein IJO48_04725, partial [Clostridia bacterium]|nr:hypothetical protein [Clostridia bacterium]